jgi:hypothetical protein
LIACEPYEYIAVSRWHKQELYKNTRKSLEGERGRGRSEGERERGRQAERQIVSSNPQKLKRDK